MKKVAIKNESGSTLEGTKIIAYLTFLGGGNVSHYDGDSTAGLYFINYENEIGLMWFEDVPSDYEITTVRELLLKNTVKSEYPKLMYVSDYPIKDLKDTIIRVVFMKKCDKYIVWNSATTIEESKKSLLASCWEYAIDYVEPKIEEPKVIELSIEEIAEKLKIAPNLLRIKQ